MFLDLSARRFRKARRSTLFTQEPDPRRSVLRKTSIATQVDRLALKCEPVDSYPLRPIFVRPPWIYASLLHVLSKLLQLHRISDLAPLLQLPRGFPHGMSVYSRSGLGTDSERNLR